MLFKITGNLVRASKTSKVASEKADGGATVPSKEKRSIKAKVAGGPRSGATSRAAATSRGAGRKPAQPRDARSAALKAVVLAALDDMKALEVKVLDVRGLTDVADTMVIASGTSDRHIRAVSQKLVEKTKAAGFRPHGVEGQQNSDWILIDLNEMVVHVMLPRVREFYGLEKLWDLPQAKRAHRA
jgi:ribosome silencing factor RsfS/YbeB/iojap